MKKVLNKQVGGDHYKHLKIQPVEFIQKNNLGFLEGCIIKRLCRYRAKGGIEDLLKIRHENELLIALEYPEHKHVLDPPVKIVFGGGGGGGGFLPRDSHGAEVGNETLCNNNNEVLNEWRHNE